jgi:hypothetical protein
MAAILSSKVLAASFAPAFRLWKTRALPVILLAAAVGLVVVTVTLGAVLDGGDGWTEATAAAGIVATVVAAGVLLGTAQGWANGTRMSLAAATTAVVGIGALAMFAVAYIGGSADVGLPSETAAVQETSDEGAALSQQISNNDVQPPGYAHDVGGHPNYETFMSMDQPTVLRAVPGGTLLPTEVEPLRGQLAAARTFAEQHDTVEKAEAAGFFNTTNDVPFMGAHFISRDHLLDGKFDAGKPEGLLFSKLGNPEGEWQLVGVWYLLIPGINPDATDVAPPEGFAGKLDLWHAHRGLCTRAGVISENNTQSGCEADQGNWIGDLRWMMHVWVWPEAADNPEGVFTYLNTNLWEKQQSVQAQPE